MASASYDLPSLLRTLESNDAEWVHVKIVIHEILSATAKEPFLVHGLVDHYVRTFSVRCLDILAGIQEPHDKHFFEKITDFLKSSSTRQQTLTLLGHMIRKQPSWLYKIANQTAMSVLLKILKIEDDIPTLMNALLVLVTLLPVIPHLISPYLTNIFEIFSRLALWNTNKPAEIPDIYILHLQVGVYALFHRLYGMYPCNFLCYLRTHYGNKERLHVFSETIRPMLERVRMHPLLVTASKEAEMSPTRWKWMETHDIIMECAKVSLDVIEGTREEILPQQPFLTPFQAPVPEVTSKAAGNESTAEIKCNDPLSSVCKSNPSSILAHLMQDSSGSWSPSQLCVPISPAVPNSGDSYSLEAASLRSPRFRSLTQDGAEMFVFPPFTSNAQSIKSVSCSEPNLEEFVPKELMMVNLDAVSSEGDSTKSKREFIPKTSEDDDHCDVDQEVSDIVARISSQSDSTANDIKGSEEEPREGLCRRSDSVIHDNTEGVQITEMEESTETSMGRVIDHVYRRIRFHSQCGPPPDISEITNVENNLHRAQSCPEIVKATNSENSKIGESSDSATDPAASSADNEHENNIKKTEHLNVSTAMTTPMPHSLSADPSIYLDEELLSSALPMITVSYCRHCRQHKSYFTLSPPEILDRHILLGSNVHTQHVTKAGDPCGSQTIFPAISSVDDIDTLRDQVKLLHNQLLFERYKREMHSERNRRLLAKAKKVRNLEEQNVAKKEQVQLLESCIVGLKAGHESLSKEFFHMKNEQEKESRALTLQICKLQEEMEQLKYEKQQLVNCLSDKMCENQSLEKDLKQSKDELLNASFELQEMKTKVAINNELKAEVERLRKELILSGELQQKYREKLSSLSPSDAKTELHQLMISFQAELQTLKQQSDSRMQQLDANRTRVAELENQILQKDKSINEQKNLIKNMKEEYEEQIQAVKEENQHHRSQSVNYISHVLRLDNKLLSSSSIPQAADGTLNTKECAGNKELSMEELQELQSDLNKVPERESQEYVFVDEYSQKLDQSISVENTLKLFLQEMDGDTKDYIKKRLKLSHSARRGSTSSIIGSAGFSAFVAAEAKQKDARERRGADEENHETVDKTKGPQ